MKAFRLLLVFCLVACCGVAPVLAGPITKIVVFGDSLSDSGNAFLGSGGTIPPTPPYFAGRFSNGPVWVEQLAAKLGLPPLMPSLAGGSDYAFGGAQTGGGVSAIYKTPNIDTQIAMYLGGGHVPTDSDLFVLWAGANDVFLSVMTNQPPDPAASALNLRNDIETLHAAGAKRFLVVNMPNLAYTPWFQSLHLQTLGAGVSQQFNAQLAARIDEFAGNSDLTIHELDAYGLFAQVMANPGAAGLTNVSDSALNETTGAVVSNPNEYLFWDSVHPTATVHGLLANQAAALVPEPASMVLFATGGLLVVAAAIRRRRRA
jgi:phospholipase/lecithinase/hemolysin